MNTEKLGEIIGSASVIIGAAVIAWIKKKCNARGKDYEQLKNHPFITKFKMQANLPSEYDDIKLLPLRKQTKLYAIADAKELLSISDYVINNKGMWNGRQMMKDSDAAIEFLIHHMSERDKKYVPVYGINRLFYKAFLVPTAERVAPIYATALKDIIENKRIKSEIDKYHSVLNMLATSSDIFMHSMVMIVNGMSEEFAREIEEDIRNNNK